MLPADLLTAEADVLGALRSALPTAARGRWTVELRFEGLRLLAPVLRLARALQAEGLPLRLLFADAGAAALARRDGTDLAAAIASFSDALRTARQSGESSSDLLLLVAPAQPDYAEVEALCEGHGGSVVLINPSLEDAAIGIGSVARQRRRGFLAGWSAAYALIPSGSSALRRCHPGDWELYRLDADGYRPVATFPQKPDSEQQEQALSGGEAPGLAATLRSVDRLLEGLQN
ncbi:MAG: DUF1995 family protein [Cyanobium sp.]